MPAGANLANTVDDFSLSTMLGLRGLENKYPISERTPSLLNGCGHLYEFLSDRLRCGVSPEPLGLASEAWGRARRVGDPPSVRTEKP